MSGEDRETASRVRELERLLAEAEATVAVLLGDGDERVSRQETASAVHQLLETQRRLAVSELRYRTLLEALPVGVVMQDAEGRIVASNPAAERILGLSLEQMAGLTAADRRWNSVREDGSPASPEEHPSVISRRTGLPVDNVVMGVERADGSRVWVDVCARPVFEPGSATPSSVVISFADITGRKVAEGQLQRVNDELEQRIAERTRELAEVLESRRTLLAAAPIGIAVHRGGRWVYANREAGRLLGDGMPEEVEGHPVVASLPASTGKVERDHLLGLGGDRPPSPARQVRLQRPDGETTWCEVRTVPTVFEGEPGVLTLLADVSARRQAEERLRQQAEQLTSQARMVDLAPLMVWDPDPSRITFWSGGCERFYGFSAADAVGRNPHELLQTQFPMPLGEVRAALLRDGVWEGEVIRTRSDGTLVDVAAQWVLYRGEGGEPPAVIEVDTDIGQLKAAERRAMEAKRAMELLAWTADQLLTAEDPQKAAGALCREIGHALGCVGFALCLVDPSSGELQLESAGGEGGEGAPPVLSTGVGTVEKEAVASRQPVVIAGADGVDEPRFEAFRGRGWQACVCWPLISGEDVLGTLSFGWSSRQFATADGIDLISAFAKQLSIAIERGRSSAALVESRDRLEAVLASVTDAYFALDSEWRLVEVNQVAKERIFHRTQGGLIGTEIWSHLRSPADVNVHRPEYELARSTGKPVSYEGPFRASDGHWFEHHVYPRGPRLEVYLRDLTQKQWAQLEQGRLLDEVQRLALSLEGERDLLRTIMERTRTHLAFLDNELRFVHVNSAFVAGSGHTREELLGADHFALFPNPENQAIFEQVRDGGEAVEFVAKPFVFADQPGRGTTYWDWTLTPVKDQRDQVRGLVLSLQDVTGVVRAAQERERLLAEIDAQRRLLQTVFDEAPAGIVLLTGDTLQVKRANAFYRSFLEAEFRDRDLTGMRFIDFVPGAEEAGLVEIFRRVAATGEPWEDPEYEFGGFERGPTYWRWSLVPLSKPKGGAPDLMLVVVETTAQVAARRRLEELAAEAQHQADELDAVFSALAEGVVVYDASGRAVRGNPAALNLMGIELGRFDSDASTTRLRLRHLDGTQVEDADLPAVRALRGESVAGEELVVHTPGQPDVVVLVSAEPLVADDRVGGAVVVVHDVTARKRAERQILASLREKEVLLQEIHHRVKNNLQIVASLLNLQLATNPDPALRAAVDEAQRRVRALALVHEKLYGSSDLANLDIREYLHDLLTALLQTIRSATGGAQMREEIEDVRLSLEAAIPLALIVSELVSNALKHAFPNGRGGEVVVGLRGVGEGRYALTVADDGVGMPDELDPEKAKSLGLQLVSLLVAQIGGTLDIDRSSGTRFAIVFADTEPAGRLPGDGAG